MFYVGKNAAKVEKSGVLTGDDGTQWLFQLASYHQGHALVYEGIIIECEFYAFGGLGHFAFSPAARCHTETLLTLQNSRRAECHKRAALKQFKTVKEQFEVAQGIKLTNFDRTNLY